MDANKLKAKMIENDLNVARVADKLGLHKSSLYRKMSGKDQMTVSEAMYLKELLGLNNAEALDIFLPKE